MTNEEITDSINSLTYAVNALTIRIEELEKQLNNSVNHDRKYDAEDFARLVNALAK